MLCLSIPFTDQPLFFPHSCSKGFFFNGYEIIKNICHCLVLRQLKQFIKYKSILHVVRLIFYEILITSMLTISSYCKIVSYKSNPHQKLRNKTLITIRNGSTCH